MIDLDLLRKLIIIDINSSRKLTTVNFNIGGFNIIAQNKKLKENNMIETRKKTSCG